MKKNMHRPRLPTNLDETIGARIKVGRLLRNISQEELAEALGITFQQIQKYEWAQNRVSASRLFEIARILDLSFAYFFGEEDVIPKKVGLKVNEEALDLLVKIQALKKPEMKLLRNVLKGLARAA